MYNQHCEQTFPVASGKAWNILSFTKWVMGSHSSTSFHQEELREVSHFQRHSYCIDDFSFDPVKLSVLKLTITNFM